MSGKAESDKIIFADKNKDNGFIMLPDLKWNVNEPATLQVLVLANKRIKSLRELDASHLPLLENIRDKGTEIIETEYGVKASQLRVYLHYQPSYYHLHVHFSYLMYEAPGKQNYPSYAYNVLMKRNKY